jgi:hypothetical protein
VGLERGPLRLVSTTEELLERKSSDSSLENLNYGRRDSFFPLFQIRSSGRNQSPIFLPAIILRCRGNVFIELSPSNDMKIYRKDNRIALI